jgi:hypothetical protein
VGVCLVHSLQCIHIKVPQELCPGVGNMVDASTVVFDLHNLAAFNYDPLNLPANAEPAEIEEHLLDVATANAQLLIDKYVLYRL